MKKQFTPPCQGGPTPIQAHSAPVSDSFGVAASGRSEPELPDDGRRGFYVASRASIPARAEMWRRLRDSGVPINSTWINEDGAGQTEDFAELWSRIQREVAKSAALILYVESDDFPLKGALVEVGIAMGVGIPIYVVAPGVTLEPRTCRPLGSWLNHPLVKVVDSLDAAIDDGRRAERAA